MTQLVPHPGRLAEHAEEIRSRTEDEARAKREQRKREDEERYGDYDFVVGKDGRFE